MATVMSDFLQQLFTLIFMIGAVIIVGGRMSWVLLIFVPIIVASTRRVGRSVRKTTRRGQDKLAEIQNIVQETIMGNGIVKAFGMEPWEMSRFRRAADRLLVANMRSVAVQAISSPLMDALGAVAIALLLCTADISSSAEARLESSSRSLSQSSLCMIPFARCRLITTASSRPSAQARRFSSSLMHKTKCWNAKKPLCSRASEA